MATATQFCQRAKRVVSKILNTRSTDRMTNGARLCRLVSVVQQQLSGQNGAGLMGGMLQEAIWRDMLLSNSKRFSCSSWAQAPDADYYFDGHPISHKTIGRNGTGRLALAWSKNPPKGRRRDAFTSSMAIAVTREPAVRPHGLWFGMESGYYLIPLTYLKRKIHPDDLVPNNKTDSVIPAAHVVAALKYARKRDLWIPLDFDYDWGEGRALSYWAVPLRSVKRVASR